MDDPFISTQKRLELLKSLFFKNFTVFQKRYFL